MKFAIKGKVYDATALEQVTLKDILIFERQAAEVMGRPVTWAEVGAWADELEKLSTDRERQEHPAVVWLTAITIWASRIAAGERLDFGDAIDFPVGDLTFLPEPQDHKPGSSPGNRRARTGSAPGVGSRAAATGRKETSEPRSIAG